MLHTAYYPSSVAYHKNKQQREGQFTMSFCNNCGNQLGNGERFCGKCGAPVGAAPQQNQQNNQQQPQQQQYQQPQQQYQQQQQGQMYQSAQSQGSFADSAKAYGKKAYGATDTFLSNQFGVGLGSKKMLYMIILLGVMLFVLIFMITKSYATHLHIDSSILKYYDRDDIAQLKEYAEREIKDEFGILFGAAEVVNIIFNFLPMLAATLVACIPFFNKEHIWKRGYLLFLRIFLFYNAGSLLLTQLIYMIFNSTIGTQSAWGTTVSYTISLSATAVIRLLLEIGAIVLTFLIRSELLKEQPRPVMNTYNAYPGGQEYANSAAPQDPNNNNTGMYQ